MADSALGKSCLFALAFALCTPFTVNGLAGAKPVHLTWDPSPDSWIQGYNVYRSTSEGGPFVGPINGTIIEATWYVDDEPTLDPGGTYCYRVTMVNADDLESVPSNEVCVDRFLVQVKPDASHATFESGDLIVIVAETGLADGVTYSWTQLGGPPISPADWNKPDLVFPAPDVTETMTFELRVDARYGQKEAQSTTKVTISP